jgi:hypothetical protein
VGRAGELRIRWAARVMRRTAATLLGAALATGCSPGEVHLIPTGYKGDVVILTGYPGGVPAKRDGRTIVFEIPPSGILVSQDHPSSGWHFQRYYYVGDSGRRQRLENFPSTVHDTPQNRSDHEPVVALRTGEGESRGMDLPCPVFHFTYYVGTRAHLVSRTVDEANAQDRRVRELVKTNHICQ